MTTASGTAPTVQAPIYGGMPTVPAGPNYNSPTSNSPTSNGPTPSVTKPATTPPGTLSAADTEGQLKTGGVPGAYATIALRAAASAEGMLAETVAYVRQRKAFGRHPQLWRLWSTRSADGTGSASSRDRACSARTWRAAAST